MCMRGKESEAVDLTDRYADDAASPVTRRVGGLSGTGFAARSRQRGSRVAMSRGNALCHTLQAAPGEFDTRSVPATGDCFFDALDLQLPAEGRADELLSAGQMRDTVADSLNEEILCATTTPALEEIAVDSAF